MERPTERRLFDDETGCLTDGALAGLMEGSLDELQRLEVSEHLSYCDACVERYTALLADGVLLEAPELMKQSVLAALRRKAAKVFVNRYFHMAVAASLTLVLWGERGVQQLWGGPAGPAPGGAEPRGLHQLAPQQLCLRCFRRRNRFYGSTDYHRFERSLTQ